MVCVYRSERSKTITNNSEQSNKDIVNDVDDVQLLVADVDPADKEKNPGKTEQGDQSSIEGNGETQRPPDVLSKGLQALLELGTLRMEHVSDIVVEHPDVFLAPSLQSGILG